MVFRCTNDDYLDPFLRLALDAATNGRRRPCGRRGG
jgi:hypothetical protein